MERAYTEMLIMGFSVLRDYGFLPLCFSVFPKFAGLNMLLFFFLKAKYVYLGITKNYNSGYAHVTFKNESPFLFNECAISYDIE